MIQKLKRFKYFKDSCRATKITKILMSLHDYNFRIAQGLF